MKLSNGKRIGFSNEQLLNILISRNLARPCKLTTRIIANLWKAV